MFNDNIDTSILVNGLHTSNFKAFVNTVPLVLNIKNVCNDMHYSYSWLSAEYVIMMFGKK